MHALAQLLMRWNALPQAARASIGAIGMLCGVLAIAGTLMARQPRGPLFAQPLHPEQLTEVEERLAGWNVAFTPTSDNVVVELGRRNDLLLRLSLAGVPHAHLSSTGEAVASIGMLTPQAVIDAQTREGLSGDIEAGLRGIDGIDDARVIVAPAKLPEFADESGHDASASVRLRLHAGMQLSREAVSGIRAFVAASVPELKSARVTILDDRGVALGQDSAYADDAGELQQSLQSALDGAFGEGAALVRVRAEYDGSQYSEHDVRRMPVSTVAIERMRRSETYDGNGKRYRHLDEGEDRGSETQERLSQNQPGAIRRLSTAVFVDETWALDLAKVRTLAAATVGYDARRGDTLAVEAIDFRRTPVARKDGWWLLYGTIVPLAPALIMSVGLVACARFVIPTLASLLQTIVRRVTLTRAQKAAVGFTPGRVHTMLEQEPPHAAAAIISALPAATATAVLELYPPHEREAIVRRMQRAHSPLLGDPEEFLRRHA
jgi:flagellar M-ring protein FliF